MYDYDSLRGRSICTDHRAIASTIPQLHQIWYHYSEHNKDRLEKPNKGDRAIGRTPLWPAAPSATCQLGRVEKTSPNSQKPGARSCSHSTTMPGP